MKRLVFGFLAAAAAVVLLAVPAGAHVIVVDGGNGGGHVGWVGSEALPAQGQGLVPGGPGGDIMMSPSHVKGLVTACYALMGHGNAAVMIFGPPTPNDCPHGT